MAIDHDIEKSKPPSHTEVIDTTEESDESRHLPIVEPPTLSSTEPAPKHDYDAGKSEDKINGEQKTTAAQNSKDKDELPEGGWGWVNALAGSESQSTQINLVSGGLVLFNTFGMVNAYGVFQTYYQTVMFPSESSSVLALIGAVQGAFLFVFGVFAGKATAYFGTRVSYYFLSSLHLILISNNKGLSIFGSFFLVFSIFM